MNGEVVTASVGAGAGAGAAAVATTEKAYGADGPLSTREIATVGTLAALLAASVASAGGPEGAGREVVRACQLLVANHTPGVGGRVFLSLSFQLNASTLEGYFKWGQGQNGSS